MYKPYKSTHPGSVGDAEYVFKQGKPLPKVISSEYFGGLW